MEKSIVIFFLSRVLLLFVVALVRECLVRVPMKYVPPAHALRLGPNFIINGIEAVYQ
jgi:hypothetical protein